MSAAAAMEAVRVRPTALIHYIGHKIKKADEQKVRLPFLFRSLRLKSISAGRLSTFEILKISLLWLYITRGGINCGIVSI